MHNFKVGDTVRRVAGYHQGMSKGDTAKIYDFYGPDLKLEGYGDSTHTWTNFELVQDEKESIKQFLKENSWFIRTGSPEKSKLVQEWLFEHGMGWLFGKTIQSGFNDTMLTNTDSVGEKGDFIMFSTDLEEKNAQEIKITFKTIVESVELPVVESKEEAERKKKIQELKETIALAQKQLEEMN